MCLEDEIQNLCLYCKDSENRRTKRLASPENAFSMREFCHKTENCWIFVTMIEKPKPSIGAYFRLFMSTFFIFGAIGIAMGYADELEFVAQNRMLVAIPVLLYGLFRLYMAIRGLRGQSDTFND
jgi:hypothetical protein